MKNLLLAILLLCSWCAMGQTGTIKGKAMQQGTVNGVPFATVTLLSSADSAFVKGDITDSTGRFELPISAVGTYILEISSIEYQKVYRGPLVFDSVNVVMDLGNVSMVTDQKLLNEVVIRGEKPAFERRFDKTIINVSSNSLFKTSINAIDVLKRSPGIRVGAGGGITLRNNVKPMVLIDGKPVPMSSEELANYLNSLMQDQIESIEIIENPSVRYDGEYKGVIDIKLKRDKNLGWSGNVSAYGIRNSFNSGGAGVTTNYKAKKVSFFGTYWYNRNRQLYKNSLTQFVENNTQQLKSFLRNPGDNQAHSYQIGTEYSIAAKQTIGVLYKGFNSTANNPNSTTTRLLNTSSQEELSSVLTKNIQLPSNHNQSVNASYRGEFGKKRLSIDASYADYNSLQNQNITDFIQGQVATRLRSNGDTRIQIKAAQLDYTFPVGKGKVDIGSKIAHTYSHNDLKFDTLSAGQWILDKRRSNEFKYDETILAGYLSYSTSLGKKVNLQLGLRAENTKTNGNSVRDNEVIAREYLKMLPNLKLGYQINDDALLSFAYSRRIQRPSFYDLNPFRWYVNPYMYTEGNPFLRPTIINTANIAYSFKEISSTISYRKDVSIVSQIPYLDTLTNITLYTRQNLGNLENFSWDISYAVGPAKWWKMQHYLSVYYLKQNVLYEQTIHKIRQAAFSFQGNNVFTLPKSFTFEVSYEYNGKSKDLIYNIGSYYQVSFAVQKSFLSNNLNAQLVVNDIFFTGNPRISANLENFRSRIYQTYDNRSVKLQLTYKFGKSTFRRNEKRSSGADEENRARN
ncbi:TonB-dependent receptor [Dyadobacter chenwenxiniae]|uniref:TonB-dependent receptor n=1 Tax=Dyadobacter chenwenxiniae TaxID=2906456 RepID=A0A9X1PSP2_9BACT|nr:TonB-dependent receptor [Dyadobacter chenwenxiniae]MCF0064401.1 TonB-dependent receptor [Dyadobacter chenwenxiniae]UON82394.1 TonB-dependent receptor [Dyadobacter chenwenxiniae]